MIEDVADYVRGFFQELECPAPVFFGEEHWFDNAEPPRVVFTGSSKPDKFLPPMHQQAAGEMPQTIASWQPGPNPQSIARRVVYGLAKIWAAAPNVGDPTDQRRADQAALDALVNAVYCALFTAATGTIAFTGGSQVSGARYVRRGFQYELEFTVEVPIVKLYIFPPGLLDLAVKTFPERPLERVDVTVDAENAEGAVTSSANFDAGPEIEES